MRREAEREREASLWRGRVLQVDKEVTDNQVLYQVIKINVFHIHYSNIMSVYLSVKKKKLDMKLLCSPFQLFFSLYY